MDSTILDLGEDLSGFLATLGQPIRVAAREMIVFELYRRSLVSSGKAAQYVTSIIALRRLFLLSSGVSPYRIAWLW